MWAASRSEPLDVAALTAGQPFCAGVLIVQRDLLLTTLSSPQGAAAAQNGTTWQLGGVGGGQEPGEDVWATAEREAREEIGTKATLLASPRTLVQDLDLGTTWSTMTVESGVAPFAVQRTRNNEPDQPFKPGGAIGPYTYFSLFSARIDDDRAELDHRGDSDTAGLLWAPIDHLAEVVGRDTPFQELLAAGGWLAAGTVAPTATVRLDSSESLAHLAEPLRARTT